MQLSRFQKTALCISGIAAFAIGAFILLTPHAFYSGYGIPLGQDPNLLSELRAPGAGLAALGAIMIAGAFRASAAPVAVGAALAVYLAFPLGRIVSLALDGMPSDPILVALAVEVGLACLLLAAFGRGSARTRKGTFSGIPG